jgi:hypothetical protein
MSKIGYQLKGTAWGILVGVGDDMFEVISWEIHSYCVSCIIKNKKDKNVWRFVLVYGSAYDELKL